MHQLFVRLGSLAEVHAVRSAEPMARGRRVLVRTSRGVELGEIIGPRRRQDDSQARAIPTWEIVRGTTPADEWLIRRLQRHKQQAVEECRRALQQSGSRAILLDVDQLFDGGTLIMHFLGDLDDAAQTITQQVAMRYESIVRTERFARLLEEGCGPMCGSDEATGCGNNCAGCSARIVCHAT